MKALLPFELKKLIGKKSVLGMFIVVLLAILGLFYINFFNGQISGYSMDKIHGRDAVEINKQFAEKHTGQLSNELLIRTIKDYTLDVGAKNPVFNVYGYYVTDHFDPKFRDYYFNLGKEEPIDFSKITPKSQTALGSYLPFKELKLGNFAPWNQLFLVINSAYILILLLSVYFIAPVFSGDTAKNMNPILLTTRYGRNKLTIAKIISSYLISTSAFVTFYAIIFAVFVWYFGLSGWDTSVQLNLYWINNNVNIMAFPEKLTLLGTFINLVIYQFIGLILITAITILISSKVKSPLTGFALSAASVFVPSFLMDIFQAGIPHKILSILSVSTASTPNIMLKLAYDGFFGSFWVDGLVIVMIRLAFAFLCLYLAYLSMKRVSQ
ncbi:membrane protein [Streptococcus equi subsp. zooepidemicus Sz16]|uniref:membrane protein n=1 Tax=Streptococcus equi TaxID=1336 RepID=UPI0005BD1D73|nr:membrane protein [Streptococcus equi]KIS06345.1 membrane protein [Streptococcus equi subsp. zooepidemicus Sz16]KIS16818.1 membrane protein [Streptococcus equi subsp. zooepidemicus SzAM35]MDI5944919.1 hypothetical protein [Streptococcus equi subsp. zooepidemicus]VTP93684.1 membrane protein [Streptococcus equi subsp. zooepidemicus]HEK9098580.1 hypothetical protein [Streptococcus equi subsp. zooepidemicus]